MQRFPRLTPRKLPQQRRSRELVDAIFEATRRVLVKEGFAELKVAVVSKVAGVSPGSLYQYFPSKESLVVALHRAHVEDWTSYLGENLMEAREGDLADIACVVTEVAVRIHTEHVDLFWRLDEAATLLGTHQRFAGEYAKHEDMLRALLLGASFEGDAALVASLVTTTVRACVHSQLAARRDLDAPFVDELTRMVRAVVVR